jgi:predicted Zn finger-like uncharacterized protein
MRTTYTPAPHQPGESATKCPSCGSRDVVTTSKVIDSSTYWRCGTCGEVWNIGRQREASRYTIRNPFGR